MFIIKGDKIKISLVLFFILVTTSYAIEVDVTKYFGTKKLDLTVKHDTKITFQTNKISDKTSLKFWIKKEPLHWKVVSAQSGKKKSIVWKDDAGVYSLQADIFEHGKKKSYYLGQIHVLADNLVKNIRYTPNATALNIEDHIHFNISTGRYNTEKLEFAIWVLEDNKWKLYQDYKSLPLTDMSVKKSGVYDIQINIRKKDNHFIEQKLWINSFSFSDKKIATSPIYRLLISDDFSFKNQILLANKIANELYISMKILYMQYKNIKLSEFKMELMKFEGIKKVKRDNDVLFIHLKNNYIYKYHIKEKLFYEKDSPSKLSLDLKYFSQYNNLFHRFDTFDEVENILFAIFYSIYEGFYYGTPNSEQYDLFTPTAHCFSLSNYLWRIFKELNISRLFLGLKKKEKEHYLVQIKISDKNYILDPSNGYVYIVGIKDIVCKDKEFTPIVLQQQRELDYLDLKNFFSKDLNLWIAKTPSENVNLYLKPDYYLIKSGKKNCKARQ